MDYRATTAQWHAERAARRPKPAKLASNRVLRSYVQDRLAGHVTHPGGGAVAGPAVPWKGRRHGPRQHRRWARAWSPQQIAARLRLDYPDDESMRISHEAIYQALYVQGRGALKRELTQCLRTGRALRVPRARAISWQVLRHPGDPHQRTAGRGGGPGRPRALGGRSDPRAEPLRHWHARGADHAVHTAVAPAADGGAWDTASHKERASARRAWGRGGAGCDHHRDYPLA